MVLTTHHMQKFAGRTYQINMRICRSNSQTRICRVPGAQSVRQRSVYRWDLKMNKPDQKGHTLPRTTQFALSSCDGAKLDGVVRIDNSQPLAISRDTHMVSWTFLQVCLQVIRNVGWGGERNGQHLTLTHSKIYTQTQEGAIGQTLKSTTKKYLTYIEPRIILVESSRKKEH